MKNNLLFLVAAHTHYVLLLFPSFMVPLTRTAF